MSENSYSFGWNEESFEGDFPSVKAALVAGFEANPSRKIIFVGVRREPHPPEDLFSAEAVHEAVTQDEDYQLECAESWPIRSEEMDNELTLALRDVYASWVKKHQLEPDWFVVEDVQEYTREQMEEMDDDEEPEPFDGARPDDHDPNC